MNNLAELPEYQRIRMKMEQEMTKRLLEQGDPRMYNKGYIFDQYPDMSGARQFYNRTKAGKKVGFGWINKTDFEYDLMENDD